MFFTLLATQKQANKWLAERKHFDPDCNMEWKEPCYIVWNLHKNDLENKFYTHFVLLTLDELSSMHDEVQEFTLKTVKSIASKSNHAISMKIPLAAFNLF